MTNSYYGMACCQWVGLARALIQYIPSGLLKTAPRARFTWCMVDPLKYFLPLAGSWRLGSHMATACMGTWGTRSGESAHTMPSGLLKAATHSLYMMHGWSSKNFFATCRFITQSYERHAWEPGRLGVTRALSYAFRPPKNSHAVALPEHGWSSKTFLPVAGLWRSHNIGMHGNLGGEWASDESAHSSTMQFWVKVHVTR